MRNLRIFTVIIFVVSLLFSLWANWKYYSELNTDGPELTNDIQLLQISVHDEPAALMQGLKAYDADDGDLTDQIMIASVSHFLERGLVNVKYVVFDSQNNSASLTRRVQYTDYESPRFSLTRPAVYTVGDSFDLLKHVRVNDSIDGDISDRIRVISNRVNSFTAGYYPVVLEVSNSCGDTSQLQLWVTYSSRENTAVITLREHIIYLEPESQFDPYSYILAVTDRNAVALDAQKIQIQGSLDLDTPGTYNLVYCYDDGNLWGQSAVTVAVTERQD